MIILQATHAQQEDMALRLTRIHSCLPPCCVRALATAARRGSLRSEHSNSRRPAPPRDRAARHVMPLRSSPRPSNSTAAVRPAAAREAVAREALAKPPLTDGEREFGVTAWLKNELGFSSSELASMLAAQPQFLVKTDLRHKARPAVFWLRSHLRFDGAQVRRALVRAPSIADCSVHEQLQAAADWIQLRLALKISGVARLIAAQPVLLTVDAAEVLAPIASWLQEYFQLNQQELAQLISAAPALFGFALSTSSSALAERTHQWGAALQLDAASTRALLLQRPSLLTYLDIAGRVEPKLQQCSVLMSASEEEVLQLLCAHPRLLSASSERMAERCSRMAAAGVQPLLAKHVFKVALDSDAVFEKWLSSAQSRA
jgi:mTERF